MATTTTHNTYGAEISVAAKRVAASKFKKKSGFVYPIAGGFKAPTGSPPELKKNVSEGGYFSKAYGISLIKNNLKQLFNTYKGERVMLAEYGISLQKYLFEPLDETTFELIKNEILTTLETFFSIVQVVSLSVFSSPNQAERSQIYIGLTLQLLDESLDIFDIEVTIE